MRKHRTDDEWRELINQQKTSGLSAACFSKEEGIHPNFFYKKRRELRTADDQHTFVELNTTIHKQLEPVEYEPKIKIGRIEIQPGNISDRQQLLTLMKAALEATDAQI